MKVLIISCIMVFVMAISVAKTPENISYETLKNTPPMQWTCQEIEKNQDLLASMQNDDYKIYASNVKEKFELYASPSSPDDKYLITQAVLKVENPMFDTGNLLKHISSWIETNKGWKVLGVDKKNNIVNSAASINIANNASFLTINKISIAPTLSIQLVDGKMLVMSFMVDSYQNVEFHGSEDKRPITYSAKISKVFPFVPKSSYKISYAKAYVNTYKYFWNFISQLRDNLNDSFQKDNQLLAQLYYEYSRDSLNTKYGEPTKIVKGTTTDPDLNKEIIFYENAKKVVCMGKTIDFKDVVSCEVADDPEFIPGRTTTYGAEISFFGLGFGGSETRATPDKTIHNFVVHVKIDNLAMPFVHIATGRDEQKAREIASSFEYIIRHQQDKAERIQPVTPKKSTRQRR